MNENQKPRYCGGCHDNFYNGNNNLGVERCWNLNSAKVVWRKEVPLDQRPPWKQKAKRVLDCYHRSGYVYVEANRER